jgi:hypothetical protein
VQTAQGSGETISLIGQPPPASSHSGRGATGPWERPNDRDREPGLDAQDEPELTRQDEGAQGVEVEPDEQGTGDVVAADGSPPNTGSGMPGVSATTAGLQVGMWELAAAQQGIDVWRAPPPLAVSLAGLAPPARPAHATGGLGRMTAPPPAATRVAGVRGVGGGGGGNGGYSHGQGQGGQGSVSGFQRSVGTQLLQAAGRALAAPAQPSTRAETMDAGDGIEEF